MPLNLTWKQALAWRMERQLLATSEQRPIEDVVSRLGGVQAQVASSAALAICIRGEGILPADVAAAIADGRLIKTWAMRGTLHLVGPEDGGNYLSLLAAARWWDSPAMWRGFDIGERQFDVLRHAVRDVLSGRALTKEELADAVTRRPGLERLGGALRESWGTILKPMACLGDLCFGPSRDGRVTFTRPENASAAWTGVPDPEVAAPNVVAAYLGAYGPATLGRFRFWLSEGKVTKRQLASWFHGLGDRIVEVSVEGEPAYVLAEHLDTLATARPTTAVRLVPGFDQWVLGGGTDDTHVIPAGRRRDVSRQSGWISPSVIAGGIVKGTWAIERDRVRIAWFTEAGRPPLGRLGAEVERLEAILDRDLRLEVVVA